MPFAFLGGVLDMSGNTPCDSSSGCSERHTTSALLSERSRGVKEPRMSSSPLHDTSEPFTVWQFKISQLRFQAIFGLLALTMLSIGLIWDSPGRRQHFAGSFFAAFVAIARQALARMKCQQQARKRMLFVSFVVTLMLDFAHARLRISIVEVSLPTWIFWLVRDMIKPIFTAYVFSSVSASLHVFCLLEVSHLSLGFLTAAHAKALCARCSLVTGRAADADDSFDSIIRALIFFSNVIGMVIFTSIHAQQSSLYDASCRNAAVAQDLLDARGRERDASQEVLRANAERMAAIEERQRANEEVLAAQREMLAAQKEMLAANEEKVQMRDRYIGALSHDFGTPIAAMHMALNVLADTLATDPAETGVNDCGQQGCKHGGEQAGTFGGQHIEPQIGHRGCVQCCHHGGRAGHDVAKLITSLRASLDLLKIIRLQAVSYSALASGVALSPELEPFEPRELLEHVERVAQFMPKSSALQLVFNLDPECPALVVGNRSWLMMMMINLLSNAFKYAQASTVSLGVSYSALTQLLTVEVSDDGVGVPASFRSSLFRSFSTTSKSGSGLGLYNVQQMARGLGGTAAYSARTPVPGSVFTLHIPCAKATVAAQEQARMQPQARAQAHGQAQPLSSPQPHSLQPTSLRLSPQPSQPPVTEGCSPTGEALSTRSPSTSVDAIGRAEPMRAQTLQRRCLSTASTLPLHPPVSRWADGSRDAGEQNPPPSALAPAHSAAHAPAHTLALSPAHSAAHSPADSPTRSPTRSSAALAVSPAASAHAPSPEAPRHAPHKTSPSTLAAASLASYAQPRAQPYAQPRSPPGSVADVGAELQVLLSRGPVLVVEDDPTLRWLTETMLSKWGAEELRAASDGQEAMRMLTHPHAPFKPAWVIMDVQMPVLDGIQTTRAIREYEREQRVPRQDRLRIIGFSANGDDDFCREQASDVGFDAMLCKPLKMTLLKACLAGIDGRDAAHAAEAR
uniref:histidine kinase n=1 Tax=Chrysotila carterae TaxID=13221 RepID=A0A7S4B737_CHRCT